ncbi:MAG: DUF4215 domain-containing protein [Patescibacteria group bacterium]
MEVMGSIILKIVHFRKWVALPYSRQTSMSTKRRKTDMKEFFAVMILAMVASIAQAVVLPPTPIPSIPRFITCPEMQFDGGRFVLGDHASHHNPGDAHGIIGGRLPDTTILPSRNLFGVDDVYRDPNNPNRFVQCYCSLGDPDVPDGLGIQTQWRIANTCLEAVAPEVCALHGRNWNFPFYDGGPNGPPAIAFHSVFYSCRPQCGNGTLNVGEVCDDDNRVDGDGCDANCNIEKGCGNGIVEDDEECDDGNRVDSDACSNHCTLEGCDNTCPPPDECPEACPPQQECNSCCPVIITPPCQNNDPCVVRPEHKDVLWDCKDRQMAVYPGRITRAEKRYIGRLCMSLHRYCKYRKVL